ADLDSHETSMDVILDRATPLRPKQGVSNPVQVVGSRSHMSQETLDYMETLKASGKDVEVVSKGSSLKLCLVAEGQADVYPRVADTVEWETAGGQTICNAFGIAVIGKEANKPSMCNKENLLQPLFLLQNT